MHTGHGGAAVAVGDQNPAFGRLVRGEPEHADGLAGGIAPAGKVLGLGGGIHFFRREHPGMIQQLALGHRHGGAEDDIKGQEGQADEF